MAVNLEDMKGYLRVDGDEEDNLISSLISAAEKHLQESGVKDTENDLYSLAVKMLVTEWYEHRGATDEGNKKLSYSLQSMILLLK
ncbi:head-tail connector protein [Bacillus velezensis]|uniref:head-tail connector protein n=1 Tax=Bacillus TaxID=1386 RepID=UPI001C52AF92|nr:MULTISPECIES: head-tail connector protein [Bacillus amyloliquefaciens group]MBV2197456.1 head-tail connector protein [Bacillus velezensis]MDJ1631034.1 head-tail connector protein [Bacillus velezensis]QXP99252.1 head-tail connector protein [Bacillus velezensis]UHH01321.1 head-tail connector protein [Bacillus amyloliquefaciens]ULR21069.1 head-tail connector protein [Bacillus velezensis]